LLDLGYQHAHEPVPPLQEKNPAIPPQVEAVILKALAKEPKEHFGSEQACIQTHLTEQERAPSSPHPMGSNGQLKIPALHTPLAAWPGLVLSL